MTWFNRSISSSNLLTFSSNSFFSSFYFSKSSFNIFISFIISSIAFNRWSLTFSNFLSKFSLQLFSNSSLLSRISLSPHIKNHSLVVCLPSSLLFSRHFLYDLYAILWIYLKFESLALIKYLLFFWLFKTRSWYVSIWLCEINFFDFVEISFCFYLFFLVFFVFIFLLYN